MSARTPPRHAWTRRCSEHLATRGDEKLSTAAVGDRILSLLALIAARDEFVSPDRSIRVLGLIDIELFATLDLVGQAPGGLDEDPDRVSVRRLAGAPDRRGGPGPQVDDGVPGHRRAACWAGAPDDIFAAALAAADRRIRDVVQQHPEVRRLPRNA